MKLFIAIDDVTEERGPLHFIPAAESAIMEKKERHFAGRLDDDVVASYAGEKGIISAIMKAGEGLFIDTCTCAHYGSRGNTEPRYLLLFHYISKLSPIELHMHGEKIKPNASLIPQGGASNLGAAHIVFNPGRETTVQQITVRNGDQLVTDNSLFPPTMMKIDVEGHELEVTRD